MITLLLAGLFTAAVVEWLLVGVLRFRAGLPLVIIAAIHIVLVLIANAVGVQPAGNALRKNVYGVARISATTAAWLAPLAVYLQATSIWAIPLASMIAARVVILIRFFEPETASAANPRARRFFYAALCMEGAAGMAAIGEINLAASLVSVATAMTAWYVTA